MRQTVSEIPETSVRADFLLRNSNFVAVAGSAVDGTRPRVETWPVISEMGRFNLGRYSHNINARYTMQKCNFP
jgi:hypothetical protein